MTYPTNLRNPAAAALAGIAGVCLIGCASNPPADAQIALAKASIARAEQAGAPQAAPTELAAARDKLARAEKGNDDHHSEPLTKELAEQANVDAQVAEAMALQQRSHKAAMDFDASMQTLQQESSRSSQPQ
jgi:hypothetical protein